MARQLLAMSAETITSPDDLLTRIFRETVDARLEGVPNFEVPIHLALYLNGDEQRIQDLLALNLPNTPRPHIMAMLGGICEDILLASAAFAEDQEVDRAFAGQLLRGADVHLLSRVHRALRRRTD